MGLVEDFLLDCQRGGLKDDTISRYRQSLRTLAKRFSVNLETCGQAELLSAFDRLRVERTRLGKPRSVEGYNLHVTVAKMALAHGDREELADGLRYLKPPDRKEKVAEKLIPPKDRQRLIQGAHGLQERLIFELLDETGARRGELVHLRIRDVQFETIEKTLTAILHLSGKSGTGLRRVYFSAPDLRDHINNHPQRGHAEAQLLLNVDGNPMSYRQFYNYVTEASKRILGYRIHPHRFRHTRATEDAKHFTDQEMKLLNRWKTAKPVEIYAHLSMRDVGEKDLVLHGLKAKEDILRPIMQIQRCAACKHENAPIAVYCSNCGGILAIPQESRELLEMVQTLKTEVQKLKTTIGMSEAERRPH